MDTESPTQAIQNDQKPGKLELFKQSFAILKGDKEMVLFPISATVYSVVAAVVLGLVYAGILAILPKEGNVQGIFGAVMLFVYYLVMYYILIYFNVGLAASVLYRFQGNDPTFRYGLAQAKQKKKQIFEYALLAAIVGWLLQIIAERFKFVGVLVKNILGMAWSLATVFIAPVIITSNLGAVDSVKESARIFKQTWGETILGNVGFALIGLIGILAAMVPVAAGFLLKDTTVLIIGGVIAIITIAILSIVLSACSAIYRTALFFYATKKQVPKGFGQNLPLSVKARR